MRVERRSRAVLVALALVAAGCARARETPPPRAPSPSRIGAYLSLGQVRTMMPGSPLLTYASAFFVDSTRGLPEAGYWRVPAGTITVSSAGRSITLRDERSAVSGVGYSAQAESVVYVPGATYVFGASGTDTVGALRASVTAPQQPQILAPASDAVIPRGRDLLVRWAPGAAGDSIDIELQPHSPSGYPRLTYHVADTGRLVVPKAALEEFPSDHVTMITASRRVRVPVRAEGLKDGRLEASATDFVHVHVARRPAR